MGKSGDRAQAARDEVHSDYCIQKHGNDAKDMHVLAQAAGGVLKLCHAITIVHTLASKVATPGVKNMLH